MAKIAKPSKFVLIENEAIKQLADFGEEIVEMDLEEKFKYFKDEHSYVFEEPDKLLYTFENTEIKNQDLIRLAPATFMNDTIVNFFIKVFSVFLAPKQCRHDVHVFNTYFWRALEDRVIEVSKITDKRSVGQQLMLEAYKSLSRVNYWLI